MIGIINQDISTYIIIEKIRNNFPKIDIYWLKEEKNIEKSILLLEEKNCKIIIVPSIKKKPQQKDITILSLEKNQKEGYVLDQKELKDAIQNRKEENIKKILKEMNIPKDKIIRIMDPSILWVEKLIKEIYPNNNIETNIEELIEKIKQVIKEKGYNSEELGQTILLTE